MSGIAIFRKLASWGSFLGTIEQTHLWKGGHIAKMSR